MNWRDLTQPIILKRPEITTLADYQAAHPETELFRLQRDTSGVLWLWAPGQPLYKLSPAHKPAARQDAWNAR